MRYLFFATKDLAIFQELSALLMVLAETPYFVSRPQRSALCPFCRLREHRC